jgi:hypothetical protein
MAYLCLILALVLLTNIVTSLTTKMYVINQFYYFINQKTEVINHLFYDMYSVKKFKKVIVYKIK